MDIRSKVTKKLAQATADKTELNRQVLRWKKSFGEVEKVINGQKKKNDK